MHISKGSFKLNNRSDQKDDGSGWLAFWPLNLWLVPVAAAAIFFVYNIWLFVIASLALAIIFYKKLVEEYKKTNSRFMRVVATVL